jgi:hypothetical protein
VKQKRTYISESIPKYLRHKFISCNLIPTLQFNTYSVSYYSIRINITRYVSSLFSLRGMSRGGRSRSVFISRPRCPICKAYTFSLEDLRGLGLNMIVLEAWRRQYEEGYDQAYGLDFIGGRDFGNDELELRDVVGNDASVGGILRRAGGLRRIGRQILSGICNPKLIMKDKSLNLKLHFRRTIIMYPSRCISIYLKLHIPLKYGNLNSYLLFGCLR